MAFKSGALVTSRGHNFGLGTMLTVKNPLLWGGKYIINFRAAKWLLALKHKKDSSNYLPSGKISKVSNDPFSFK